MITHNELQIILEAKKQDVDDVLIDVVYPDGTHVMPFCGTCGRMIHSPDCPRANWS